MKKSLLISFSVLFLALGAFAQNQYEYFLNLNAVQNDELSVSLNCPQVDKDTVEFHFPKIVPGTYDIYDFGRFAKNFVPTDSEGNRLLYRKIDDNRYAIYGAKKLSRITYKIEDTFDTKKPKKIFEPAGTNIEKGANFLINTFGFFGYLDGYKNNPFVLEITKPDSFYGASALDRKSLSASVDQFSAANYFDLSDSPLMYSETDTILIDLGETEVTVAVYSPNKVANAQEFREDISQIMKAQLAYLGGTLPVDRYVIMIYLFEGQSATGASGALEHSYSTVFSMPELPASTLSQWIKDVTAHEFFHIVTPLNIHSEHIHDYDFITPQMSKHLWLYEGSTEYAAQHMQATAGLFSLEQFLAAMRSKIVSSKSMYKDELPFTEMSKKALDEHANQYGNVYEKGALIAMCLDILILEKSQGEKNLRWVMNELATRYGKSKAFSDDSLLEEITQMTDPAIAQFFERYVAGSEPLPLTEYLSKVGIEYADEKTIKVANLGVVVKWNNFFKRLTVSEISDEKVAKKLKLKEGATISAFNGVSIKEDNYNRVFYKALSNLNEKEKFTISSTSLENGSLVEHIGKGKCKKVDQKLRYYLSAKDEATEAELKLRKEWLSN